MNKLFEYIEKELLSSNNVSLDTWGNQTRTAHYENMVNIFNSDAPVMEYEGNYFIVTSHAATNGMGGMSEGSPHTYIIKRFDMNKVNHIKSDRPMPLENPDFTSLIKNLESTMDQVVSGDYHEDNDDSYYLWEDAMKAVYGEKVFNWWNKNT